MDNLRGQLITLFMIKSGSNDVTMSMIITSIIIICSIDKILMLMQYICHRITKYVDRHQTPTLHVTNKEKTSSITIEVFLKQPADILAHSMLDYITTCPNIQSILYTNQHFMLNHNKPILINEQDDIYMCLLNDIRDETTSQLIEIYSYVMNIEELRTFIKKVEYNYTIKVQNKL